MNPIYTTLACLALYFGLISAIYLLSMPGHAIELSITGSSAGLGTQNLSFAGDLLNVSIQQNGTSWNLSLMGAA